MLSIFLIYYKKKKELFSSIPIDPNANTNPNTNTNPNPNTNPQANPDNTINEIIEPTSISSDNPYGNKLTVAIENKEKIQDKKDVSFNQLDLDQSTRQFYTVPTDKGIVHFLYNINSTQKKGSALY
jgi:hypothetical protein